MNPQKGRSQLNRHRASSGFAEIYQCSPTPVSCRAARTNQRTIYGLAMVLFSMFKFSVNLLLGVAPEPMNASITFFLGCVGAFLIVSGQLSERNSAR
jgi:hypothetical protein